MPLVRHVLQTHPLEDTAEIRLILFVNRGLMVHISSTMCCRQETEQKLEID